MHFVCRTSQHVVELAGGEFDTGFWKVASKNADTVEFIALHGSKTQLSYRQGAVVRKRLDDHNGSPRFVFTVRPTSENVEWEGMGTGEKGYFWE